MIFAKAQKLRLPKMDLLDIGGGFAMTSDKPNNNFTSVAPKIREYLKRAGKGIFNSAKIMGEPGRFFCEQA